jgi:autotransporter-associated beta strand protein
MKLNATFKPGPLSRALFTFFLGAAARHHNWGVSMNSSFSDNGQVPLIRWAVLPLVFFVNMLIGLHVRAATVAYYRFEEGQANQPATTILDSSGNNLNGAAVGGPIYQTSVPVNPIHQTGATNNLSLDFNGVNQRIAIPDNQLLQLPHSLTLEAYVNAQSLLANGGANWGLIVFRGDDRSSLDPYFLGTNRNGVTFEINTASNAMVRVTAPLPLNQWVEVAGTLDDATGNMNLYENGVLVASTVTTLRSFGPLDPNEKPGLGIGSLQSGLIPEYFDGLIDEVRISDTALTPDQFLDPVVTVSSSWTGTSSTEWADSGNWSAAIPGATVGTTNTDAAVFNQNAPNSPSTIDAGRNIRRITFDTANVNSLTIGTVGGQALLLTAGGTIQTTATVVNPQMVNAPLVLEGDYTFTSGASSSSATLSFGGGITPAATSGVTMLTLNGGNAGTNTIGGVLTDNGSGQLAVTMSGTGLWILSGANTYSGNTTVNGGTLRLTGGSTNNVPKSPSINVGSGATLDVTGLADSTLILGSGNVAQALSGRGTVAGSVAVNGGIANGTGSAPAGSAVAGGSGATLTITGGVVLQNGSVSNFTLGALNGSGNPLTAFANVMGAAGLTVNGTHTVNLLGAAQLGTYELYAFTTGTPLASQFSIGTNTAGNFGYAFTVTPNAEVDLVVTPGPVSAAWDFNGDGNYSDNSKWNPALTPSGPGLTATFGNGVSNTVNTTPSITVLIDGAGVAGSLGFSNSNGTGYILGNDGVNGHGIKLDNNGLGAAVNVTANTPQAILANLTLADNAAFTINSGSSLSITGNLSEVGGGRTLAMNGPGTLTLGGANSYSGGTTINSGTLKTTASGALGSGPLTISALGVTSTLTLGANQTVSSLTSSGSGTGAGTVSVASGNTLISTGALTTTGTFKLSGLGTTEIDGAPTLNANTKLLVSFGALRFKVTSGAATVGTGVTATVGVGAKLELAGSVSALSSGANRVNITSISSAHGILVSGTHQQVGSIDGGGNTQVNAGSDLTANHIIQAALVIGGIAGSRGQVTIAASDAGGNPLGQSSAQPSGSILASSFASNGPFGAGIGSPSLLDGGVSNVASSAGSEFTTGDSSSGAGSAAVPEPSTLALAGCGLAIAVVVFLRCRPRKLKTTYYH